MKTKQANTSYLIKINNELVTSRSSLKEARKYIKSMPVHDDIFEIDIVKQTVSEVLLDKYKTKVTKVLVVDQLDNEL